LNFEADVYEAISPEACVNGRNLPGGPAAETVKASIQKMREKNYKNFHTRRGEA